MIFLKKTLSLTLIMLCCLCSNVLIAQDAGVSADLLQEYETLMNKCFDSEGNPTEVDLKDVKRIEEIYSKMSDEQKTKVTTIHIPEDISENLKNPLPKDGIYFINGEKSTLEKAVEIVEKGKFKLVRKKTADGYEFHIQTLG